MRKTKTTTVTEHTRYHLSKELKYDITVNAGVECGRHLIYTGKEHFGYAMYPAYDFDTSILKTKNPYHADSDMIYELKKLPDPEDIDLNKITYQQGCTHMFYDVNKRPLSVVVRGDYMDACLNNRYYRLSDLRDHLLKRSDVVSVSEILDIPYYNAEEDYNQYLDVVVYPSEEAIDKLIEIYARWPRIQLKDVVFGHLGEWVDGYDYLDIKQFSKEPND